MAGRRPRKPRRRFPNVGAVWSGGKWKWRAVTRVGGRQLVGHLRGSQEEAYEDAKELRQRRVTTPSGRRRGNRPETIAEAGDAVLEDARARGLPASTVASYDYDRRVLCSYLNPQAKVSDISSEAIEWLIQSALRDGYTANTVSTKLLRVLRLCFEEVGLEPTAIREARGRMRTRLTIIPPRMPFFAPEEVQEVIHRIRTQPFETRYRNGFRTRERDADLVQLLASTGLRSGELSRLRIGDVDLDRRVIYVAQPKVRSQPREVPIPNNLASPFRRLLKSAEHNPGGLIVRGGMQKVVLIMRRWQTRLEEPRLHARALRHSYATGLLLSGADVATVRDLLGHRTLSAVTSRYAHSISSSRQAAAERLSQLLVLPENGRGTQAPRPAPDGPRHLAVVP